MTALVRNQEEKHGKKTIYSGVDLYHSQLLLSLSWLRFLEGQRESFIVSRNNFLEFGILLTQSISILNITLNFKANIP